MVESNKSMNQQQQQQQQAQFPVKRKSTPLSQLKKSSLPPASVSTQQIQPPIGHPSIPSQTKAPQPQPNAPQQQPYPPSAMMMQQPIPPTPSMLEQPQYMPHEQPLRQQPQFQPMQHQPPPQQQRLPQQHYEDQQADQYAMDDIEEMYETENDSSIPYEQKKDMVIQSMMCNPSDIQMFGIIAIVFFIVAVLPTSIIIEKYVSLDRIPFGDAAAKAVIAGVLVFLLLKLIRM